MQTPNKPENFQIKLAKQRKDQAQNIQNHASNNK